MLQRSDFPLSNSKYRYRPLPKTTDVTNCWPCGHGILRWGAPHHEADMQPTSTKNESTVNPVAFSLSTKSLPVLNGCLLRRGLGLFTSNIWVLWCNTGTWPAICDIWLGKSTVPVLAVAKEVAALQRSSRSRSGRTAAEDRSTANCGETFCLVILSVVCLDVFLPFSK